jgi:SAM-dependent methyltransferase
VAGVEPQEGVRKGLESLGYEMYRVPEDIPQNSFDVITLFHTLEHLIEPLEVLDNLKQALRPGGVLIVEVPHARDALFALDAFKNFSLWGEHMILHTQESLRKFLSVTGFNEIEVFGHQRYPASNHLGWLALGLPGGQKLLASNGGGESEMEMQYRDLLISNDKTDTIMAIARV